MNRGALCGKGAQAANLRDVPRIKKDIAIRRVLLSLPVLCLILLNLRGGAGLWAQSVLDTPPAAGAPPATTSFFPLDQVHRGLHGVAYTVFEGTRPEPMGVEILGLLHNAIGPDEDMIVARLEGAKPEYSGVVAGMSGSPVFIDGKLVGAIAYRIGQFSKEPICGITPIAQMLENRSQPGLQKSAVGLQKSRVGDLTGDGSQAFRPIDAPLVFSGFSPEAVNLWREHAPSLGLTPVAGIGGAEGGSGLSGMAPAAEQHTIEPGSAVSAVLVRGDLEIAATCTVTYVDPKQLLACGHPITQFGPVSYPMTKADVVATLPSPLNAFKIINTGEMIGSFTEDRQTAIRGQFGLAARMIPLTIHVAADGGSAHTLHLEVVDQEQLTPSAVLVSLFQGLMESNTYAAETTYRLRGKVALKGYPAVRVDDMIAPSDAAPSSLAAALAVSQRFERLYENAARSTPVEGIDIDVQALSGRRAMQLESVQSEATEARGGDTVSIDASVRPWHGETRNIRIPVKLPATLGPGEVRLLVSNGEAVDRLMQPPNPGAPTEGVAATIAGLNSLHASDRMYVTLLAPETQAAINGRTLTALPLSMANAMAPERENHQLTLNGESAVPLASVGLDSVLNGEQVVTLKIE